jgi:hypothetical protein
MMGSMKIRMIENKKSEVRWGSGEDSGWMGPNKK